MRLAQVGVARLEQRMRAYHRGCALSTGDARLEKGRY